MQLEPPDHLSPAAREEWDRVLPALLSDGLVDDLDRSLLAAYCVAYARWAECEKQVKESGVILRGRNGALLPSPYLTAANTALDQMRGLAMQVGIAKPDRQRERDNRLSGSPIDRALFGRALVGRGF